MDDLAAPGHPLLTLERTDSVDVLVSVAETAATQIHPGKTATVQVAGVEGFSATGHVQSVIAVPQGRAFDVRLRLANAGDRLRSGQFARVRFLTGSRQALLVDVDLIVEQGQLRGVYVATAGHAVLRWLRLGERIDDRIEVLSGLQAGERVVKPSATILDGVRIEGAS